MRIELKKTMSKW